MLKTVAISSGGTNGTVTSIAKGTGLTGGPITTTGTISLANTAVTAGSYGSSSNTAQITIDAQGRITSASNVAIPQGTVTSVTGTAPIASSGGATPAISLNASGVTAATYGAATQVPVLVVDTYGRITSASNVANPQGTVTSITAGTGLSGGTITSSGTVAIANTAVTAGTYGTASQVSQVTINAQGQITSAANVAIAIANSAVSGLGTMATQNANAVVITGGTINSTTQTTGKYTNANVTSVAVTFPNSFLANSTTTLGNTALTLGGTTSSVGNVTLTNVTIGSGNVNVTSTTVAATTNANATFSTSSLLLIPQGFINVRLNGTVVRVPYYAT